MDGPFDELVQRILGGCARDAGGRAAHVIAEARREAEEEVKALVKSAMKAALLREAASALEGAGAPGEQERQDLPHDDEVAVWPVADVASAGVAEEPPPDVTRGWYVYGIARAGSAGGVEAAGVTGSALAIIRDGDVEAVVNEVPVAEFENALKGEVSQNLQWLEAKARAHDLVLKGLLSSGPVIPFRFCTILRSEEDVRAMLGRHRAAIARTLKEFDGKREWGVKIFFDSSRDARVDPPGGDDEAGGKSYLLTKKRRRDERGEAARRARAVASEFHQQLAAIAADAVTLPARRPKESPGDAELLVNGAYLVADAAVERFRALLGTLAERHAGLTLKMTGPWPAYNFVRLDLSMEAAA